MTRPLTRQFSNYLPRFSQVCHDLTINPRGRINACACYVASPVSATISRQGRANHGKPPDRRAHGSVAAPRACRPAGAPASASRWCRPWARCIAAIWRWLREARRRADRVVVSIFVNPTQFAPQRGLRQLSARLCRRPHGAARGQGRSGLGAVGRGDVSGRLCHPHRAARRRQSRAGGQVPPAFLRRRRHRGGQAVHASCARFRDVRREGLPAAARRHPDGEGSRSAAEGHRRADRARERTAWRCRRATPICRRPSAAAAPTLYRVLKASAARIKQRRTDRKGAGGRPQPRSRAPALRSIIWKRATR